MTSARKPKPEGRIITEPVKLLLPVKPRSKKNSQRWIKTRGDNPVWKLTPSEAYVQYEKDCGPFIRCKGMNISCLVNIKATFYIDADRPCDISNFFEALADMLVHYQVILDDNRRIVQSWDGSRVYVDRQNPRTEVIIEPVSEDIQTSLDIEKLSGGF
ncbi:MAG: hypothetical protein FWF33_05305 [Clostridiales bacterium]|nr:hypothetical protein [Clostridiales bacterium]